MPRKRITRNRKRNYRRKKKIYPYSNDDKEVIHTGKSTNQSVVYRGIGIPPVFYTKLKYNETFAVSSIFGEYLMNGNSIYDPDRTGVGHQPMYADQFADLYRKYHVTACSINLSFINRTSTGDVGITPFGTVGVYALTSASASVDLTDATERDNCSYSAIGPSTGDQGIMNMSQYKRTSEVVGKNTLDDDLIGATGNSGTNPALPWIWHIFYGSSDKSDSLQLYINVTLTYYVRFFDRILQVGS